MILGIHPYVVVDGRGKEAIAFYEDVVEAKVLNVMTFADMPESPDFPIPANAKDLIMNAHLKIGDSDLMLSDSFPGQPILIGDQITIAITTNNVEKTKQVFEKLQDGGQVIMPLQKTFWSPSFGQLRDKFGVFWQVNTFDEQYQ